MSAATATSGGKRSETCDARIKLTRSLLGYGVIAGPIYLAVGLIEALTRSGFDLARHDLSLLSNGDLGWIHIALLVITGLMVIAGAVGMRRALRAGRGGTWGPGLLGAYGAGLVAAGLLVADAMDGFPVGTPAGRPVAVSWHGLGHLVGAGIGFLCLIAACFVFARRFWRLGQPSWATFSAITGVVFLAGFAAIASGSGSSVTVLAFWVAVVLAWTWVSAVSIQLYRRAGEESPL